jgi:hypothetical protein
VIGPLGEAISLLRVAEPRRGTCRDRQEFSRWGRRQLPLEPWIHRWMKMSRHAGDDDPGTPDLDDRTELLERQSNTKDADAKDRVYVGLLG